MLKPRRSPLGQGFDAARLAEIGAADELAHDDEIHSLEHVARLLDYFGSDALAWHDGNLLFAHVPAPIVLWHIITVRRFP